MALISDKTRQFCLASMLTPIARFCLRYSLRIQDAQEALKIAFVDAATQELKEQGLKINVSRLSVATGINRREIMRIYKVGNRKAGGISLVTKVIGTWKNHPNFTTKSGRPRVLTVDTDDSEFASLVRHVSQDTHAGTVAFELERVGLASRTPRGIKLRSLMYDASSDSDTAYKMLAEDSQELLLAVEENVFNSNDPRNLHITTVFDNIRLKDIPSIKKWMLRQGGIFQDKVERYLAKFDQDMNPKPGEEGGGRVALTVFSHTYGSK